MTETRTTSTDVAFERNLNILSKFNAAALGFSMALVFLSSQGFLGNGTVVQMSRKRDTSITPADYTFGIWGLIYVLRGAFVLYHLLPEQQESRDKKRQLVATSVYLPMEWILEGFWLFAACNEYLWSSYAIMGALWILLAVTYTRMTYLTDFNIWQKGLNGRGLNSRRLLPYCISYLGISLNFAWITCAGLINIAIALQERTKFLPVTLETINLLLLVVAIVAALAVLTWTRDIVYAGVVVWAFIGMVNKPTTENVSDVAIAGIGVLVPAILLQLYHWNNLPPSQKTVTTQVTRQQQASPIS